MSNNLCLTFNQHKVRDLGKSLYYSGDGGEDEKRWKDGKTKRRISIVGNHLIYNSICFVYKAIEGLHHHHQDLLLLLLGCRARE